MVLIVTIRTEVSVNTRTFKSRMEFPLIALTGASLLGLMFLVVLN
jgi:hypothetical protein